MNNKFEQEKSGVDDIIQTPASDGGQDIETTPVAELDHLPSRLHQELDTTARELIATHQDLSSPRNITFGQDPDNFLEHEPNWHQWGVITHTLMFERAYRDEIPDYLDKWGVRDEVDRHMSEEIDGATKTQLVQAAIPLHDLGKFTERKLITGSEGQVSTTMKGHESASGRIIRSAEFSHKLKTDYGLTEGQIEYIARCAELHYELGVLRNEAKQTPEGYSISFTKGDQFRTRVEEIMQQNPDFQLEIGLLFLGDSLAKTDIRIDAKTDQEIEDQTENIEKAIEERSLNSKLIGAIKQLPVNLAVAQNYLRIWAERETGSEAEQ